MGSEMCIRDRELGHLLGELGELGVVGGEEGEAGELGGEVLRHGPGQPEPVISGRACRVGRAGKVEIQ